MGALMRLLGAYDPTVTCTSVTGEAVTDGLYIKNHKSTVLIIFVLKECDY